MAFIYNIYHWDEGMDGTAIITAISDTFLKLDGSNANTDIDIGAYNLTTTGTGTFGNLQVDNININGNILSSTTGQLQISTATSPILALNNFDSLGSMTAAGTMTAATFTDGILSITSGAITAIDNLAFNNTAVNRMYDDANGLHIQASTDIIFALGTGTWTLTLDNVAGTLKSSAGYFNFDDDDLKTTGVVWGQGLADTAGTFIIDNVRKIYEADGTLAGDFEVRQLLSSDGIDVVLDWETVGLAQFGNSSITTTGSIKNNADNSIHYFGAADDATISFTGSDLKLQSNAITATDGLILQQQNIAISSTGETPPLNAYPVSLYMDATSTRGLWIDGTTNPVATSLSSWALYMTRKHAITDGSDLPSMRLGEFAILDNSTNTILGASVENMPLRFFYDRDATAKLTNNSASNRTNYIYGMFAQVDDDGTYDTTSTGRMTVDSRAFYVNVLGAPILTDTGANSPTSAYSVIAFDANVNASATVSSGIWTRTQYGFRANVTSGGNNNYGLYIGSVANASNNYGIYDASGANWVLDGDNQKISLGETNTDLELYSDGTDGVITTATDLNITPGAGRSVTINNGLVIPSGTTPLPAVEGALFLDTDASANGTLVMYSNAGWRTVAAW